MKEAAVQVAVRVLYEAYGGEWYNLSQGYRPGGARHETTRQTKGLPDLWLFFPASGFRLWHETKRLDGDELRPHLPRVEMPWAELTKNRRTLELGLSNPAIYAKAIGCLTPGKRIELYRKKQSPEQALFEQRCRGCRMNYVLGGVEEAFLWITASGLKMGGSCDGDEGS